MIRLVCSACILVLLSTVKGEPSYYSSGTSSSTPSPSISSTSTQTSSSVWTALFDGTSGMTERVLPEPCGVLDSSSIFAIAFRVNEGNNDCGRGLWSLTHLVLSLSRVYNDSDTVTLSVEVFQMLNASHTSQPLESGFAISSVQVVVPTSPDYVKIPLRGLLIDTATRGLSFAIVLSTSTRINLHSVGSQPDQIPRSGAADVGTSWTSAIRPVQWTQASLFPGIWLSALKRSCTATPTLTKTVSQVPSASQSSSRSQSPSRTQTVTNSQTRSPTVTQSGSLSSTLTRTRSQTPTRTMSQATSPSSTKSQVTTRTQTLSPSRTQTGTGFPVQVVIDNTADMQRAISNDSRILSPDTYHAFSISFPEDDIVCGPGTYSLQMLGISLSPSNMLSIGRMLSIQVLLYSADINGHPDSTGNYLDTSLEVLGPLLEYPSYYNIPLISRDGISPWTIDTTQHRQYAIAMYANEAQAIWHSPADSIAGHIPASGTARANGSFTSTDYGLTWIPDSSYGGIHLTAQKSTCAPSSSQTISMTSSISSSSSGTMSGTQSSSMSGSETPTPSQTSTASTSTTMSGTPSMSGTRSPSMSGSETPTRSQTPTASGSITMTVTRSSTTTMTTSPSSTATMSNTPSQLSSRSSSSSQASTGTMSPSGTCSATVTGSQSTSRTPSQSQTASMSAWPVSMSLVSDSIPLTELYPSDSKAPIPIDVILSSCPSGPVVLKCVSKSFFGTGVRLLGFNNDPLTFCDGDGALAAAPVRVPMSLAVDAAFRCDGGSGMIACEVRKAQSRDIVTLKNIPFSVAPTLWPLWDDAIVISTSGQMISTRLGLKINASSALRTAACDQAAQPLHLCTVSINDAAGDPAAALAAAQVLWNRLPLPVNALGSSSFALTLSGTDLIVLRASRRAFAINSTNAAMGDVPIPAIASSDGCWLVLSPPPLSTLCDSSLECYMPLVITNLPLNESANVDVRMRLLSSSTVQVRRGASLACPPFCPGSIGSGIVPIATDTEGTSFSLGRLLNTTATALRPVPITTAATSSMGLYLAPKCTSLEQVHAFTIPVPGACSNAASSLSAQCAYGTGSSCQMCPKEALCPGGSRIWSRPGFWLPTENAARSSIYPCVGPNATIRCAGWDVASGSTKCGIGYVQGSFRCSACSPGYYYSPTGACDECPRHLTVWQQYSNVVGIIVSAALVVISISALVAWISWFKGEPFLPRAMHAVRIMFFIVITIQILASSVEIQSPTLPLYMNRLYTAIGIAVGQGVLLPSACTGNPPFDAEYALMTTALASWMTTVMLYYKARCLDRPGCRRIASVVLALAIALYPGTTTAAVGLLHCTPATMTSEGLSAINGGNVAAQIALGHASRTTTVYVLANNPGYVCWAGGGAHAGAGVLAAFTVILYVFALPMACLLWLSKMKQRYNKVFSENLARDADAQERHATQYHDPFVAMPLISVYTNDAWYMGCYDLALLLFLSLIRSLLPLSDSEVAIGAKAGFTCLALFLTLLHLVIFHPFPFRYSWMGWIRAVILLDALGVVILNAAVRAVDLNLITAGRLRDSIDGTYALFALCSGCSMLVIVIGIVRSLMYDDSHNLPSQKLRNLHAPIKGLPGVGFVISDIEQGTAPVQHERVLLRWMHFSKSGSRSSLSASSLLQFAIPWDSYDTTIMPGLLAFSKSLPSLDFMPKHYVDAIMAHFCCYRGSACNEDYELIVRGFMLHRSLAIRRAAHEHTRVLEIVPHDGGWGLQLRFRDELLLQWYRDAVVAETECVHISRQFRDGFGIEVHDAVLVWLKSHKCDAALADFYFIAAQLERVSQPIFSHLQMFFERACGRPLAGADAAQAFVHMLSLVCNFTEARALILSFPLVLEPLAESGEGGASNYASFHAFLDYLEMRCKLRATSPLLQLLRFPTSCTTMGSNHEMQWFFESRTMCQTMPPQSLSTLPSLLHGDGSACVRAFISQAINARDAERLREVKSTVPLTEWRRYFRNGGPDAKDAIISAIVHRDPMQHEHYKTFCDFIVESGILCDEFYSAFLRAAFNPNGSGAGIRVLKRFLECVVFRSPQGNPDDLILSIMPQVIPLTMESYCAANGTYLEIRTDESAAVLEYMLRLETWIADNERTMRQVVSLQKWLSDQVTGGDRIQALHKLLEDTRFLRYFGRYVCMPNANTNRLDVTQSTRPPSNRPLSAPGDDGSSIRPASAPGDHRSLNRPSYTLRYDTSSNALASAPPGRRTNWIAACCGCQKNDVADAHVRQAHAFNEEITPSPPETANQVVTPYNPHIRPFLHILDELSGLFSVCLVSDVLCDDFVDFLSHPSMDGFFVTYFGIGDGPHGLLRRKFVKILGPSYSRASKLIESGVFLAEPNHFKLEVLKALRLYPHSFTDDDFNTLTLAALRLQDYDNLSTRLGELDADSMYDREQRSQLIALARAIAERSGVSAGTLCLEDIATCASDAVAALKILPNATVRSRLQSMLDYYVLHMPPEKWPSKFKAAEKIAFMIKYLDREDLSIAKNEFTIAAKDGSSGMLPLIEEVLQSYPRPLVPNEDLRLDAGDAVISGILQGLDDRAAGAEPIHMTILARLTAEWMRNRQKELQVAMIPRNCQTILYLLLASWLRRRLARTGAPIYAGPPTVDNSLAFIAQVGTGEGKSLIIAMIACYAVLGLGKRVHILVNNVGLLERDYTELQSYYIAMGVYVSKDFSEKSQVVYTLRSSIEHRYREGNFDLSNVVLIVDEVDELIVDESPNMSYVKLDVQMSANLRAAFEAILTGCTKPPEIPSDLWKRANAAERDSRKLALGVAGGYDIIQGRAVLLDERGRVTNTWSLPLEALNYRMHSTDPKFQTTFYVQSMPHMLRKYGAILGLTGAIGSISECKYLADTFRAVFIKTPPFLNTCQGNKKVPPHLVDDQIAVCDNETAQYAEVLRVASEYSQQAPIVIITPTPARARRLFALFEASSARDYTQLFLERNEDGSHMQWDSKVSLSCKPAGTRWRITVTDYFGGRGHDYRVTDENVDASGGLVVIATAIPMSEREWIQWLGRTARNDRKGRYAVILSADAEPIASNLSLLGAHRATPPTGNARGGSTVRRSERLPPIQRSTANQYASSLIGALLRANDKTTEDRLESVRDSVRRGQLFNELCDKFYEQHPREDAWPNGLHNIALRDFLIGWHSRRLAEIAEFAVRVGLAPTVAVYKASSMYPWD